MSQTMASFPNPESIHTIKIVTKGEALIAQGSSWIFGLGIPLIAAAPFGILLWLVAFLHFNPPQPKRKFQTQSVYGALGR